MAVSSIIVTIKGRCWCKGVVPVVRLANSASARCILATVVFLLKPRDFHHVVDAGRE